MAFRAKELELLDRDIKQRAEEARRTHRNNKKQLNYTRVSLALTALSVILATVISAVAIKTSLDSSAEATRNNTDQFVTNSRMTYFKDIVDGLGSESAAVQVTSMRLLTAYVQDRVNYGSVGAQQDGANDALQTLSAFVQEQSGDRSKGLPDYAVDIPLIVDRAVGQMELMAEDSALGKPVIDLNEADLHGRYMVDFAPTGKLTAPGVDLRRAILTNLDLSADSADLQGGFLTCADLRNAHLGKSFLRNTDFTGADLSGADLRNVQDLHAKQLNGANLTNALMSPALVQELDSRPTVAWGTNSANCTIVPNEMTGMLNSQGYADTIPCPEADEEWPTGPSRLAGQLQFKDNVIAVCQARMSG